MEGRALSRPLALGAGPRRSVVFHHPQLVANNAALLGSPAAPPRGLSATTERGPPDRLQTCAQNAHEFRRTRL